MAKESKEAGLELDVDEYVDSFRPDLTDVVAAWTAGARFADILKMNGEKRVFEVGGRVGARGRSWVQLHAWGCIQRGGCLRRELGALHAVAASSEVGA